MDIDYIISEAFNNSLWLGVSVLLVLYINRSKNATLREMKEEHSKTLYELKEDNKVREDKYHSLIKDNLADLKNEIGKLTDLIHDRVL